ncbi:MAG: DsbA family protein [Candidatus Nanohaloarchaea archaeon]
MTECEFCGEEFDSKEEMHIHWGEEHEDELNSHKEEKVKKAERKKEEALQAKREWRKKIAFRGLAGMAAVVFVGFLVFQWFTSGGGTQKAPFNLDQQPMMGDPNASVTVVEFGDYRCPYCKDFAMNVFPKLKKQYIETGKVKFYFINYPFLDKSFPGRSSQRAARAAECVYKEDRDSFWDYHHAIYRNQGSEKNDWATTDFLARLAEEHTNMTGEELRQCLNSGETADEVSSDERIANGNNVDSTPTIFVNGEQLRSYQWAVLKSKIEAELVG